MKLNGSDTSECLGIKTMTFLGSEIKWEYTNISKSVY